MLSQACCSLSRTSVRRLVLFRIHFCFGVLGTFLHFQTQSWICGGREQTQKSIPKQQWVRIWVSRFFGFVSFCLNFLQTFLHILSSIFSVEINISCRTHELVIEVEPMSHESKNLASTPPWLWFSKWESHLKKSCMLTSPEFLDLGTQHKKSLKTNFFR